MSKGFKVIEFNLKPKQENDMSKKSLSKEIQEAKKENLDVIKKLLSMSKATLKRYACLPVCRLLGRLLTVPKKVTDKMNKLGKKLLKMK